MKSKFDKMVEEITGMGIEVLKNTPMVEMWKLAQQKSSKPLRLVGTKRKILTPEECDTEVFKARSLKD